MRDKSGSDFRMDRAWAVIDLDCIEHNIRRLRGLTEDKCEIIGVVKADAYGHGT